MAVAIGIIMFCGCSLIVINLVSVVLCRSLLFILTGISGLIDEHDNC